MLVAAIWAEALLLATPFAEIVVDFVVAVCAQHKVYTHRAMMVHSRDLLLASCHMGASDL